jgi:hypothetical protein
MRRNGVFKLSGTTGAEQIRAEIGRLLTQYYEVGSPPMSGNLAEVIKRLERSALPSDVALGPGETQ